LSVINFPNERLTEKEIEKRKSKHYDNSNGAPTRGHGKSKYRGVHWQKNRKRWMARYTLSHKGEKNINLGAFETAEYAAMAFDFEARKRGRPECDLNFPDKHPTEEQIEQWKTNTAHYSMMRSGRKKTSQYRGVCKAGSLWHAQSNIIKVVNGMGKETGPVSLGFFYHEEEAGLAFDRACRKFGVPEKELNFPRNHHLLKEVRLFDNECYFCFQTSPTDPVATPCNHVFCRPCISSWLEQSPNGACPCCKMSGVKEDALRSVTLVPWPVKPEDGKPRKRKRKDEEDHTNSNSSDTDKDDDDGQTGPPSDAEQEEKIKKTGSKQKDDAHDDEYSSDDDASENDQAGGTADSQQWPKRRRALRSCIQRTTRHAASLGKNPGRAALRRQPKYPVGTRFIKVRI
jgi:Ring finger domain/AP2 domain